MDRKIKIFSKFNQNLQHVLGVKVDYILCPICLNKFHIRDIELKTLILEDVPQKCLGGKKILLTCYKCNNDAGTKYENELKKWINLKIGEKINCISEFHDKKIYATFNQYKKTIFLNNKKNDVNILNHLVKNSIKGKVFHLANNISNDKLNKSIIKSAYLYFYYLTGYNFILDNKYETIRRILRNNIEIPNGFHYYTILQEPINLDNRYNFFFIHSPDNMQGILSNLKLKLENKIYFLQAIIHFPNHKYKNISTNKLILTIEPYNFFIDDFKKI
jgi:hypothetical protein